VIDHPPGAETQWDWLDLPNPPASWGWGGMAHLLVGSLAHSSRWRANLAPAMTQPHLVDGLDRVSRKLGGLTGTWRFDRMATVCDPGSGRVTTSFAGAAKHYGVAVAICPARRGNRKGVVEKANHTAAQRWWRTLADDLTVEQAQRSLDEFCRLRGDTRRRATAEGKVTVAALAATEPLAPMPAAAYPLILREDRTASRQAMVSYRGNRYSVPPELASATVSVTHVLGSTVIDIVTSGQIIIARHRLAADGAGVMVRDHGHVVALDQLAMATAATGGRAHRRKERIPPGAASLIAADTLRSNISQADQPQPVAAPSTVIDLSTYERAARGRNTLP